MSSEVKLLSIRELVEAIAKSMVDHPHHVTCQEVRGTHSTILELTVAKEDIGKVIGRKGIHADAIRKIVHAAAGKQKARYLLEIIEDGNPQRQSRSQRRRR